MKKMIYTVCNMVSIPPIEAVSKHENSTNIIYIGKMSYEPNVVAVTYFANEIFPKLRAVNPDVTFTIVGANPDKRVLALDRLPGVTVTGFVDSVVPYLQGAAIVVAPMLTGAGIQNKIIQAMSYGCCVVTTPIGAEGLHIDQNEIGIVNNTEAWVSTLSHLLSDRSLRQEMGMGARKYVMEHLTQEIIYKQFHQFLKGGGLI